jgi:hypothetical protein
LSTSEGPPHYDRRMKARMTAAFFIEVADMFGDPEKHEELVPPDMKGPIEDHLAWAKEILGEEHPNRSLFTRWERLTVLENGPRDVPMTFGEAMRLARSMAASLRIIGEEPVGRSTLKPSQASIVTVAIDEKPHSS